MANEKEDLKNQLQSIKDNLEKKLSGKEVDNKESVLETEKESKKEKVTKKNGQTKKSISVKVDMEVVADEKIIQKPSKPLNTSKPDKPLQKKSIDVAKKERPKKKKKKPVVPILLLLVLLGALFYVYNLKKNLQEDKSAFEKEKEEAIDYSNDVYFKEVEDEVDDEEMQDFAVYKDVPEVVAESNTKSETLSDLDTKNIDKQINDKKANNLQVQNNNNNNNKANTNKVENPDQVATNNDETITKEVSKTETKQPIAEKTEIKKEEVFSDMIKVIGLQHKDGSFTMPKKVKKTNAFKVRVRLKKNQISKTDKDTNIMLVIKDSSGNTIKIDSKKINFGKQNSKVLYLEFYEIFPERLKTNTNYSFSIFANKKLIKSYRKSI